MANGEPTGSQRTNGETGGGVPCALVAVAVGVASLTVFLLTLAPTVTGEDSGELIAAAWHFGVPHPPGYPLWTILCGAFVHVFEFGEIAWRTNLFSALCTSGAAVFLYAALRSMGIGRWAAAAAALGWVWSRWCWTQSVITEVYGLNSLLTAGVLWSAVAWHRSRKAGPLLAASVLMGLGMSNHHLIALSGLALALWVMLQDRSVLLRGRLIAGCVGCFIAGLVPYAYLPIRAAADPAFNWGNPSNWPRFWEHVTRHQCGAIGPIKTEVSRSMARLGDQLAHLAGCLRDDFSIGAMVVCLLGLVVMWRQRRSAVALVLLWLACTGGVFVWLANFDLDPTSRSAMRVFFIPVGMGLAIPLGFALDWAMAKLRGGLATRPAVAGVGIGLITLALPLWQCGRNWQRCDYSNYWYAADHAENMLTCVLDRALVFPSGDHNTFPLMYAILVERQRSDVIIADPYGYINPKLLKHRPADSSEDVQAWLIRYARRPAYFTTKKRVPIDRASFVTAGILYHLLPEGVAYDGQGLYEECKYRNLEDPGVLDRAARHILADYEFFGGLQKLTARDTAAALVHFARAVEYAQDIKELYNNVGSALGEHGLDDGALPYFQRAAELDARYVMPRWNLFRFYRKQEQWELAATQLEQIISATPQDFRAHGELGFLLAGSLNNPDRAVAAWERSLSINPKQPQILRALSDQLHPATPTRGDPD